MTDLYREEREARWRDGLINYADIFDMLADRLRTAYHEPDCNVAKKISDEAAHLAHATADLIQKFSVDNPPKRSDT